MKEVNSHDRPGPAADGVGSGRTRSGSAGTRRWTARLLALSLGLGGTALLFLLLELSLRLFGFGYETAFTMERTFDTNRFYIQNPRFGWRFFPRAVARTPTTFAFPVEKPEGTVRIFVLGGSAAMGDPSPHFSLGRILEVLLEDRYPGVPFEVVNAAMTAINSHVVLDIAKELAHRDADLFVIYMGNNEVIGPYGPGSVFAGPRQSLTAVRWAMGFNKTRIGQLIRKIAGAGDAAGTWTDLEMFLEKQVHPDDPVLDEVYARFRENLEDLLEIARTSGIPAVVSTVGVNLKDCAPFASLHRKDLSHEEKLGWEELFVQGRLLESAERHGEAAEGPGEAAEDHGEAAEGPGEATEQYRAAMEIDGRFAELPFRLARCLAREGLHEEALKPFRLARDLDALRFRADRRINGIIRDTAKERSEEGILLVDGARALEQGAAAIEHDGSTVESGAAAFEHDPSARGIAAGHGGIPGRELFYDHVHLRFGGNYLVAKAVFEAAVDLLPAGVKARAAPDRPLLTREACALRLGFTDWNAFLIAELVLKKLKRPPFTGQLDHADQVQAVEAEGDELGRRIAGKGMDRILAEYYQALILNGNDWRLHFIYSELLSRYKRFGEAVFHLRTAREKIPHNDVIHCRLGAIHMARSNMNEAFDCFEKAISRNPDSSEAYTYLGLAYLKENKEEAAARCFEAALKIHPDHLDALQSLAGIYASRGALDDAITTAERALSVAERKGDTYGVRKIEGDLIQYRAKEKKP